MSEDLPRIPIPGPEAETTEKMVFLQEQIVNFLRQYSMPLLEVSLVFSKYTRQLTDALEVQARGSRRILAINPVRTLANPW